jgi:hypothetical protein
VFKLADLLIHLKLSLLNMRIITLEIARDISNLNHILFAAFSIRYLVLKN